VTAQPGHPQQRGTLPYLALALLALVWGFSYILIKTGVATIPPTVLVELRVALGAAALLAATAITRRNPITTSTKQRLPGFLLMAVTSSVLPFLAITWGQQYIGTGLAAILNATTPLWTAIFAWWVTPQERPTTINYTGVAIGFVGAVVLVAPSLSRSGLKADTLGALAVLAGSAFYAAAALGQRRLLNQVDAMEASLWQMAIATLIMLPISAPTIPSTHPSALSLAAVILLGTVGSGIAYVLYYYILNSLGATRGSSVTFLIPITAVGWGALLFHERLTAPVIAGMVVILVGVGLAMVHRRPRAPAIAPEAESAA
jgi:drug/metabolite transporter (DMT)-like permease